VKPAQSGKVPTRRLRHRIRIEEPNLVDNGRGGRAAPAGGEKWRALADRVPAEVVGIRGGVALEHLVERHRTLWRVTIRMRRDLLPSMRIVHGDVVMTIKAIVPSELRDALVLTCESGGQA